MATDKIIYPNEFLEELLILFFVIAKGLGIIVAGFLYGALFSFHFIFQWFFLASRHFYNVICEWPTSIPPIFKLEED